MKAFLLGLLLACLIGLIGYMTNDKTIITMLSGSVGLVSFLASGLYVGVFVSSDRIRIQYQNETKEERIKRVNRAAMFFLLGLPNLLLGIYTIAM
ncbi:MULTISPECIES: DUF5316 family protein [Metabacillus]|jgi:hypothetical protein|uniref:DUF5316 domain-containing protein n=3 Tax=Metabacillus TaxID=2675233 RepID=A0A179T1X5_9BACI|nr:MULTISPECIES: DUF5316 family protein [Metabacillus]OAS87478.1 hypothetical protein A6K24_20120 [Metabacillus litoralis]QNF30758.1 hypothetical protein HUW50_26755 [Metabacillus sp. KUDC1714]